MNSLMESIRSLCAYDTWANGRIFDTAALLTPDQFTGIDDSSYGSVRNTLVHIVDAQQIWLFRISRSDTPVKLKVEEYPDVEAIRVRWIEIDTAIRDFVNALDASELDKVISYFNSRGEPNAYTLWQILFHQINHGGQHRGELAMVLTSFGCSPGWLDYLHFLDLERKSVQ